MTTSHAISCKLSPRTVVVVAGLILLLSTGAGTVACMGQRTAPTAPTSNRSESDAQPAQVAVRSVLEQQESAWNSGDIDSFMRGYKDSPETTFISRHVEHGYQKILQRYKRRYGSRAAMGTLRFSGLNIQILCAEYAIATGGFHLARTGSAGGDASGVFSLLFQKTSDGWKILLDHTSAS